MSFIFGEGTKDTYETLQKKRAMAEAMGRSATQNAPNSLGTGLTALGKAIAYRRMMNDVNTKEKAGQDEFGNVFQQLIGRQSQPEATPITPVRTPDAPGLPRSVVDAVDRVDPQFKGGDKESFIQEMLPHAMRVSKETGIDPRLVIAQAAQETGWGRSAPNNNYFGIKSHGKPGGVRMSTSEHVNGQDVTIQDSFRGYDGMGQSADDYAAFLKSNPRYSEMLSAVGLDSQVSALGRSGYATDPNYSTSVGSIANSIKLPGYRSQSQNQSVDPMLLAAAGNPYANEGQKSVLGMLLQQQIAANDPMTAMKLKQAELDYEQDLNNPNGEAPSGFVALDMQAISAGLVRGTPEYQEFMLNGGGVPAAYRALKLQAIDAGHEPGTPEYERFMETRGAYSKSYDTTTGTNTANIETGGAAAEIVAEGTARGKENVEKASQIAEMERNMPGLLVVVEQLEELADKATYTIAGQGIDYARKQMGLDPTKAAVARAEYIAIVDNQVLPLLRQTFGPAFTEGEGERLRATLGDPDKSPAEKKAVLRAFIAQKKRNLESMGGTMPDAKPAGLSGLDTKEAFINDPGVIAAADKAGVTPEAMWAIKQGMK